MRTIKLFAVIGLAVALMGVLAMAQAQQPARVPIEITGTPQAGTLTIQVDSRPAVSVQIQANQQIQAIRDAIVQALNRQQQDTATSQGLPDNRLIINATQSITIGPVAPGQPNQLVAPFSVGSRVTTTLGLVFSIVSLPTLTEWGLIALAVLLAGGMGYMIYRRRPALRPAAP